MPEEVFDADGNSLGERPTQEELAEMNKSLGHYKTLSDGFKELELGEDVVAAIKDLKESSNPNWQKARKTIDNLKKKLESSGVQFEINEQGEVIDKGTGKQLTEEQVAEAATKAARGELVNSARSRRLSQFDEEKRKVINHYFDKLTAGESITTENVDQFMEQAISLSGVQQGTDPVRRAFNSGGGNPPAINNNDRQNFADTPEGKGLAAELGMGWAKDTSKDNNKK